ncbi:outer membrane lipoprotein carrier protein LolA [Capnocytophaga sp.]|uniref:LolA family protein n=1 Tax=Capnocytophaga sp. TaxID=44737 RepID=UPI0026DD9686|nr:outer membrane lipoprotein carrier protein LolA [Capnocytophaga sp.]MDO5105322.1 outer membrane lipoprotein carrier protein LolA [Capnocytophaga sp.]
MKKIFSIFLLLTNFVLLAQQLSQSEVEQFKAKLLAKNQTVSTIEADFQQKKHLDFMSKDIKTSGKMAFLKPDKLNWQYTTPYSYRIVFQKDNITIDAQGNVSHIKADNKIFKKINHLIVGTISGSMFNEKEFNITLWKSNKKTTAKLKPKDKTLQKYINEIHLFFTDDALVEKVKLIEPSMDYTEIVFINIKINTKIDDKAFRI